MIMFNSWWEDREQQFKENDEILIFGWMCDELKLGGNDLLVYALIYGGSQFGNKEFNKDDNYISKALNIPKENVEEIINSLYGRKLIEIYPSFVHERILKAVRR